jgi:hypothetical protein
MNTLYEVEQINKRDFIFRYLRDYPVFVDDKPVFHPLTREKDGIYYTDDDGDKTKLKISEKLLAIVDKELIKQFLEQAVWREVKIKDGSAYIFPPEPDFLKVLIKNNLSQAAKVKYTLKSWTYNVRYNSCGNDCAICPFHGPYYYIYFTYVRSFHSYYIGKPDSFTFKTSIMNGKKFRRL